MTDDEDKTDDFSPDENSSGAEEFNPYESFLKEDEDGSGTAENFSGCAADKESEDGLTTEEDISLPDFLKTGSSTNVREFSERVASQPVRHDENKVGAEHSASFNQSDAAHSQNISGSLNGESAGKGSSFGNKDNFHSEKPESDDEAAASEKEEKAGGGDTFDGEDDVRFKPKVSADEANRHPGGKPRVLNKKFLLTVIICAVGGIFLVTFLMPGKKGKSNKNAKPVAETHVSTDYASIANRHPLSDGQDARESGHYGTEEEKPEKDEVEIPPVIPDKKPVYNEQNINYNTGKGSGNSSAVEIPDTRNDALHGKQIAGIKGLTSTQASYSTDYQQTIAKNTASSAASGYSLPSKDEYMKNVLSAYSSAYGNATAGNNSYAVQNDQSGKNSFFNNGRQGDGVGQGEWLNLNTLWQGSIFEAVLTSELNTDLPGEITARIAKNVYSSQDGRYLLIPQNSVVYGTYNSSISYSQSRVQVAWHTLIRPDGYQIQLGNMNATDAKGASGLSGFVNDHPVAYLKAIGLMSVFSIVNSEFESAVGNTNNQYVQNIMANSQQVTNELADKLIDRAMNVQPTIKIKSGTKINIVVNQNLTLPPVENSEVTMPYRRRR